MGCSGKEAGYQPCPATLSPARLEGILEVLAKLQAEGRTKPKGVGIGVVAEEGETLQQG